MLVTLLSVHLRHAQHGTAIHHPSTTTTFQSPAVLQLMRSSAMEYQTAAHYKRGTSLMVQTHRN